MIENIQSIYDQFLRRYSVPDESVGFPPCTHICAWLKIFYFKDAKILGYHFDDNPTAVVGEAEGGHDFLVVEGKYIIDFWYRYLCDPTFPLYIPIEDAHKYYGDNTKWAEVQVN